MKHAQTFDCTRCHCYIHCSPAEIDEDARGRDKPDSWPVPDLCDRCLDKELAFDAPEGAPKP